MQRDNTRIVGIAWYDRREYAEARGVMRDAHVLPVEYDAWLRSAELVVLLEEAKGSAVIRAPIRPAVFADWCTTTARPCGRSGPTKSWSRASRSRKAPD